MFFQLIVSALLAVGVFANIGPETTVNLIPKN